MGKNERYQNWSIRTKLLISHCSIILLVSIIVVILLFGMKSIKDNVDGIYNGPVISISNIGKVRLGLTDLQRAINRLMISDADTVEKRYPTFEATVEKDVSMVKDSIQILEEHMVLDEDKAKFQQIVEKVNEGGQIRPKLMELLKNGEFDDAYNLNYNTYIPIIEEINNLSEELETMIHDTANGYYVSANRSGKTLITIGIVLLLFGFVFGLLITIKMTRAIVEPINQITDASRLMYKGDMSAGNLITYISKDEIGVLADSLRGTMSNLRLYINEISEILEQMAKGDLTRDNAQITDFLGDFASIKESFVYILKRFNSTLSDIQKASNEVDSSAAEIASASQLLSEGNTDQASAIEELTATIGTVASLAESSSKKTQQAYDNIRKSTDRAEQEKEKMEELTEEMERITEISREIENIITTIEDIASQTNLLSLNASIEAARAGEAGSGFAVVANQIGKLASDSAQSAVNTRELIIKTLEEIEKGNTIAASTSVAFKEIINNMRDYADVAQETNDTTKNQAIALEQIEQGIDQISAVVQNTASASEKSANISDQLSERAGELDNLVRRFKLY